MPFVFFNVRSVLHRDCTSLERTKIPSTDVSAIWAIKKRFGEETGDYDDWSAAKHKQHLLGCLKSTANRSNCSI